MRRDEGEEVPQIARVDPAHRQQDVQVGDAEVRVVRGLAADPGAEADVATQQGGQLDGAAGRGGVRGPEAARGDPELLGREVAAPPGAPGPDRQGAAVRERDGAAAAGQLCPVAVM